MERAINMKILLDKQMIFKSFLLSLALMLGACSTFASSTHYYVLETPQVRMEKEIQVNQQANEIKNHSYIGGPLIALLPIGIPNYLDRQQIVTHTGKVGLDIHEDQRWGEDLSAGIARILSNSITDNLSEIKVLAMPLRMGVLPDYTIQVEINYFEGALGGKVQLSALWYMEKEGQRIWQSTYENSAEAGDTYPSYVQAYAYLLDQFGKEMAEFFFNFYEQKKK